MSRRSMTEMSQWCLPNRDAVAVREGEEVENLERVKKPGHRGVAINTLPWDHNDPTTQTVEFRLFKGTLVLSSLLAALEIVHHSITLAQEWDLDMMAAAKWGDVVKDAEGRGYNYLVEYVKERGVE